MSYNPAYGSHGQNYQNPTSGYAYSGQPQQGFRPSAPGSGHPTQYGYPGQPPQQGYPGQPPQSYPGQPPQSYPGQPPQSYPGQPPQSYPGTPQHGYLGSQQSFGQPGIDPTIMSWFRAVDQDNSGQINGKELSMALQNGNNSNFSDEACNLMIALFDIDHSGTINVQEFSKLFQYINQWTEVYKRFDQDKSGTIDEREMESALQQMGFRLSPQFISHLVNKFDKNTRKISLDNFIVANIQLNRLTEAFKKKDVEMKGFATFSYEEFITLALSL